MATVVATGVTGVPPGYNNDNRETFQGTVPVATSGDTVTYTLPERWRGRGVSIVDVTLQKFATAAVGARTKTSLAVTSWSYVESTGVLSVVIGADVDTNGRLLVTVVPGT